jgi:hypothetical protein
MRIGLAEKREGGLNGIRAPVLRIHHLQNWRPPLAEIKMYALELSRGSTANQHRAICRAYEPGGWLSHSL